MAKAPNCMTQEPHRLNVHITALGGQGRGQVTTKEWLRTEGEGLYHDYAGHSSSLELAWSSLQQTLARLHHGQRQPCGIICGIASQLASFLSFTSFLPLLQGLESA